MCRVERWIAEAYFLFTDNQGKENDDDDDGRSGEEVEETFKVKLILRNLDIYEY